MKKHFIVTLALLASVNSASAAEIWNSETDCLQRQIDLKRTEDFLEIVSLELSKASISKVPEAQLGQKIIDNREPLLTSVRQTRKLLRAACDALYK